MAHTGSTGRRPEARPSSSNESEGRIPPHDTQAEEAVLGGILLDNERLNTAIEHVHAEDFYHAANRVVFEAMVTLWDKRTPIDIVTLSAELRARNLLDQCGGPENLARLSNLVPSAANIAYYAKVVKAMAMRRRLIHEASDIITEAFQTQDNIEEFLDRAEQRILTASEFRAASAFHKVSDLMTESIRQVERLCDRKEPITGTPSGYDELDTLTAGFQPSDLIIIAARPSMGKTSLALCMAAFVGLSRKNNVAVFSLEMSKEQIAMRMLASEARINFAKVRTGNLGERDFPKLVQAAGRIADAPIFIDDTPALSVIDMRAKARRLHREHPLALVVVDYLQLMRSPDYRDNREREISDISRSLKALAKELSVPVVALAQLNRSVESRNDKRPMMSDLRESGAIEQDADVIMFVYREEVYNPSTPEKGIAELIISKQRNGPTGCVKLAFAPEFTRFDRLEVRPEVETLATENTPASEPDWAADPF